jgi:hypothetical protein
MSTPPVFRGDAHWSRQRPELVARGTLAGRAKLTDVLVTEIRARYAAGGISQLRLAVEFDVSQRAIYCIVQRKTWTHLP